jgi:serine-type D-Ala-D-Ala carboxypeptidase (penicillin-binding protein 5/6)
MSKNLKVLIAVFAISFISFWGINSLKGELGGFVYEEAGYSPEMYLAQINMINLKRGEKRPIQVKVSRAEEIDIRADSAISILVTPDQEKILYEKNINQEKPIASIAKLMTALTAFELGYGLDQPLEISRKAVDQEGEVGQLKPGEKLLFIDLLHSMLIESSNDAAFAIAEGMFAGEEESIGEESFIRIMNKEAIALGLNNSSFLNSTGLASSNGEENYSTSEDLVKLSKHIIEKHPEIFEITKKKSYEVFNFDGSFHHLIDQNTNQLLNEFPEIIGGKTGYTNKAGGCLLLVMENPKGEGYIINIILGTSSSENRFSEMRRLIYYYEGLL